MDGSTRLPALARPRVVVLGSHRDGFRSTGDAFVAALSREAEVVHIDASSPLRHGLAARSRTASALRDGAELVHVLDFRFASIAQRSAARYGVPVTATISSRDLISRTPWAALARRALPAFDTVFTNDEAALCLLRDTSPALESLLVRPAAPALTEPLAKHSARVARSLRGVRPGRLVLGLVWPENRNDLRWFRDVVLPHLEAKPICLLLGVPSAREARLLTGAGGTHSEFRLLRGPLDAGLITATARCIDAFVSPASLRHERAHTVTPLALALAVSGVPIVTDGQAEAAVLAHERNAFLVGRGDERDFAATLNRLLALPAIQRHFLGEEFARFTLEHWNWREIAEFYADRFASLVGRPRIPAALRAA